MMIILAKKEYTLAAFNAFCTIKLAFFLMCRPNIAYKADVKVMAVKVTTSKNINTFMAIV